MIELSDESRAKAKQRAEAFEEGSDVPPAQANFEAWVREEGCLSPFLGLPVSENIALTPSHSKLAQAVRESNLPVPYQEQSLQGNKCLLFVRPPGEKIVRDPSLADHLAKEMAAKFEEGCEGPIFTGVRPGDERAGNLWVFDRTYLVLDRAELEERAIYERQQLPFEERTVGGRKYVLYSCEERELRRHPVLARRYREARQSAGKAFVQALEDSARDEDLQGLDSIARQLGME